MHLPETPIYVLLIFAVAIVILVINDATKRHAVRKAEAKGRKVNPAWKNNRTSWGLVVSLLLGVPLLLFLEPYLSRLPVSLGWALAMACGFVVLYVFLYPLCMVMLARFKRRHALRAVRRANSGDIQGGIDDLRGWLASHESRPDGWEALGFLYCMREDWGEALAAFERVEEIDGHDRRVISNKGLVLWRLAPIEEAEALMVEACLRQPNHWVAACNYCEFLADLGRRPEAEEQLERADTLIASNPILFPASQRKLHKERIERCRAKILEMESGNRRT